MYPIWRSRKSTLRLPTTWESVSYGRYAGPVIALDISGNLPSQLRFIQSLLNTSVSHRYGTWSLPILLHSHLGNRPQAPGRNLGSLPYLFSPPSFWSVDPKSFWILHTCYLSSFLFSSFSRPFLLEASSSLPGSLQEPYHWSPCFKLVSSELLKHSFQNANLTLLLPGFVSCTGSPVAYR